MGDYLTQIELESALIAHAKDQNIKSTDHRYYWWLGNTLQPSKAYLINRHVVDLIVGDIRNYNEMHADRKEFDKYLLCDREMIISADECIDFLLQDKYNIDAANTLDMDGNEKFNLL